MKMSIIGIEYKNIRKISELKLSFVDDNGKSIKNNFVMMANGTGKTTTMELIKGLMVLQLVGVRKKSRHLHQLHHILMWACLVLL